jgi:hypothetical protein
MGPDGREHTARTQAGGPQTFTTRLAADRFLFRTDAAIQAGTWGQSDLRLIEERIATWTRGYHADRAKSAGSIYFARAGDICKIGWSTNLELRLRDLRLYDRAWPTGVARSAPELLAVLPGPPALEDELHLLFGSLRVQARREWFRFAAPLSSFVEQIAEDVTYDPAV